MPSLPHAIAIAPDIVSEIVDGEAVLLDLRNGVYFALNGVATRMWQLLQEGGGLESAREQLLAEYEVAPEQLDDDLHKWLEELERRGIVTVRV